MIRIDTDDARTKFGIQPPCAWNRDETFNADVVVYAGQSDFVLVTTRLDDLIERETDDFAPADYSAESHA